MFLTIVVILIFSQLFSLIIRHKILSRFVFFHKKIRSVNAVFNLELYLILKIILINLVIFVNRHLYNRFVSEIKNCFVSSHDSNVGGTQRNSYTPSFKLRTYYYEKYYFEFNNKTKPNTVRRGSLESYYENDCCSFKSFA